MIVFCTGLLNDNIIKAITGTKNRNLIKCDLALSILFIMAMRFLSEEKLNFEAILKWLLPITFKSRY